MLPGEQNSKALDRQIILGLKLETFLAFVAHYNQNYSYKHTNYKAELFNEVYLKERYQESTKFLKQDRSLTKTVPPSWVIYQYVCFSQIVKHDYHNNNCICFFNLPAILDLHAQWIPTRIIQIAQASITQTRLIKAGGL